MRHLTPRLLLSALLGLGVIAGPVQADRTTSYTYTPQGKVATIDGPRLDVSDITTYAYDDKGNRTLVRNALGQETRTTAFDGAGRPLAIVDPNGLTTQQSYDPRGRLLSQGVSDGIDTHTTTYVYDPVGNLTQVVSPGGTVLHYHYDTANRLIGLEDGIGNRIDYTLDAMGNRLETRVSDPSGNLTQQQRQVYNQLGRLIQSIDAQDHATAYAYDANGNLTQTTDARENPTQQAYDALDRLQQTTDALDGITRYTYDAQDNLTSVTDPNGLTTRYAYDGLGNLISQTSPDTGTTTYTYDEAGNRLTQTDARGIVVSYVYDALNRLTAIRYPDSTLDVSYEYDQNPNGIGRLTRMTDAQGTTDYTYNAFGQLTGKTRTSGDGILTAFSYAYDDTGRLTRMTYPSGQALQYGYDAQGQLASLSLTKTDGTTQPLASNLQRLPFGPIRAYDYGNGLSLARTYDQDYRLIEQTIPGILQSSYQHDPVGNITDWLDLLNTGRDQQFGYDQLDRLINASGAYGALGYTYDATGNRLSQTEGGDAQTYTYATDSHRLLAILGATTDSRDYDAAGNTLQSLIGSYRYDETNRMAGFSKSGITAAYAYNGQGERISKTVNGVTTRYRYGESGQLLGEYDQSGQAIREYAYLEGQPIAMLSKDPATQAETAYYLHTDHLGAVVKATDSAQTLVWDALRGPFGERTVTTAQVEMPLGFPGQYFDEESGNFYNYFRDYDPGTGRYLQSDPIGLAGGINTYTYVAGNPLRYTDPTGEVVAVDDAILIGGTILVAACIATNCTKPIADAIGDTIDAIGDVCRDDDCPPCTPYTKGTVGYLGPHTDHDHHPVGRPHLNLFVVNQNPGTCKCFWNKNTPDAVSPPPLPSWVDLNGGFPTLSP